jgi:hypothetical protein
MYRYSIVFILFIWFADNRLSGQVHKTVDVEVPGTLNLLLTGEEISSVTDITVTGAIDSADFAFMKSMPALVSIDIAAVQTVGDSIPGYAFAGCGNLNFVALPPALDSIRDYTFAGCAGMDSVTIPPEVKYIGRYAFTGCSSLQSVNIPASVNRIAYGAFAGCQGLLSVDIHSSSLTIFEQYAFVDLNRLKKLTFHESEGITLGKNAFVSCDSLAVLNFYPQSVTSIGEGCFQVCNSLVSVTFPSSLAWVGKTAFAACQKLDSVFFQTTTGTALDNTAFVSCQNLTYVEMKSPSVTSIGEACFAGDFHLKSVVFPSSLDSIGKQAFVSCSRLPSVDIKSTGNLYFDEAVFSGCIELNAINLQSDSGIFIGTSCFISSQRLKKADLTAPVVGVEKWAFLGCDSLNSINIVSTFVSIGQESFSNCHSLKAIVLPSVIDTIASGAFNSCTGLTSIKINNIIPPAFPYTNFAFMGVNKSTCTLYVPAGTADSYRAAPEWLTFNHIIEYEMILNALPDEVYIADTTNSFAEFNINSSVNWQISADQSWLIPGQLIGMDSATVSITALENPEIYSRGAVITIAADGIAPQTVHIIQAPKPALSLSSNTLSIGAGEGSMISFEVFSNTPWTASADQSWLELSEFSGSDTSVIVLTATANPSINTRAALVTLLSERLAPKEILVTQDAGEPSGLTTVKNDQVKIFPNPATDVLYIEKATGLSVLITGSDGRVILSSELARDHEALDISSLPQGLYMIRIGKTTLKFVK